MMIGTGAVTVEDSRRFCMTAWLMAALLTHIVEALSLQNLVIDKVYNWNNLSRASRKVVSNKGCAGVDGMGVKRWCEKEEIHLQELRMQLMNDT